MGSEETVFPRMVRIEDGSLQGVIHERLVGDDTSPVDAADALWRTAVTRSSERGKIAEVIVNGVHCAVKYFMRGGLVGRVVRTLYVGKGRFFRCITVAFHLRSHGVACPEVLAVLSRKVAPGVYRGVIVSEWVDGSYTLSEAVRGEDATGVLATAASVVRRMHDAGVWHADLNAGNILVKDGTVFIIDLDGCRVWEDSLPPRRRVRNIARLARSLEKEGMPFDETVWRRFLHAYAAGDTFLEDLIGEWLVTMRKHVERYRMIWRLGL